ncbi:MAG: glycosyltransferase family 4 protein [Candidatus Omnitrophica bacterium]|nr:glycosyltransferase family 4 protein [Candidatus Omnitrophota bacterium]
MRVLVITQTVDPHDPTLGFFVSWLRHLAPLVERLEVVCSRLDAAELPGNVRCHSLGKESGADRWQRWRRFHQAASGLILGRQVDLIFAHMCPEYVLAAAPYAWQRGVPIVLWYTHRQVTWRLRTAHRLAAHVVTSTWQSFPLPSRKLTVIGHGVDGEQFRVVTTPARPSSRDTRLLLSAGRLAAVKRHELLLQTMSILVRDAGHQDVRLVIVGGDAGRGGEALAARIRHHRLEPYVTLAGPVAHDRMAEQYRSCDLLVNTSPPGLFDKVVLEALACGVPAVVCNRAFEPALGPATQVLVCPEDRPESLADTIARVLTWKQTQPTLAERLRGSVLAEHGIAPWAGRLVAVWSAVLPP